MKLWLTLNQQLVRVFGDGYKGWMEENGTYSASGVQWGYSWRCVEVFRDRGSIGRADSGGGDRLCVWVEMWK